MLPLCLFYKHFLLLLQSDSISKLDHLNSCEDTENREDEANKERNCDNDNIQKSTNNTAVDEQKNETNESSEVWGKEFNKKVTGNSVQQERHEEKVQGMSSNYLQGLSQKLFESSRKFTLKGKVSERKESWKNIKRPNICDKEDGEDQQGKAETEQSLRIKGDMFEKALAFTQKKKFGNKVSADQVVVTEKYNLKNKRKFSISMTHKAQSEDAGVIEESVSVDENDLGKSRAENGAMKCSDRLNSDDFDEVDGSIVESRKSLDRVPKSKQKEMQDIGQNSEELSILRNKKKLDSRSGMDNLSRDVELESFSDSSELTLYKGRKSSRSKDKLDEENLPKTCQETDEESAFTRLEKNSSSIDNATRPESKNRISSKNSDEISATYKEKETSSVNFHPFDFDEVDDVEDDNDGDYEDVPVKSKQSRKRKVRDSTEKPSKKKKKAVTVCIVKILWQDILKLMLRIRYQLCLSY